MTYRCDSWCEEPVHICARRVKRFGGKVKISKGLFFITGDIEIPWDGSIFYQGKEYEIVSWNFAWEFMR